MVKLKTVGIKELKNNLSAYLQEVRLGTRILVSDRNNVVAEIHGPMSGNLREETNPVLAEWVSSGAVLLPKAKKTNIGISPVKMKQGTSLEILKQLRGDSGE